MSYSNKIESTIIFKEKTKKISQFKSETVISYIEEKEKAELYKSMEQGYMEMASINLEYAEESLSCEWCDAVEYETWLFGV
ncbi:hypothetical protein SAMN02745163_04114 [Clostridium cavendishii DSM 21758]|uniref:CopG family transcriptional regulator / antitoxin EndoAI n=1 Tax=Clostridium cavendishii DSM 21758 TaxID=1121302 RepID=A0A1M6TU24_9CLOT|nr:hypothetical protein [Clostridium cavendishii]SHK60429.1 hypothetical protein SAMN02745163_04114 [Clostridium cavendishii DSM 21758]